VHRCGYTGEDGYEISLKADQAEGFARLLLKDARVRMIGLGARDSLRLEAGLCLYGHDLDDATTPVEAGLSWVIAKKYQGSGAVPARFPGAARILKELAAGPARTRLGFRPEGRIPVREGTTIFDSEGLKVGIITSGGFGQTAGGPIAMGYVSTSSSGGTYFNVTVRNRMHRLIKADLPFVEHRYYKNT
jgi:aminomethyltransferase